MVQDIPVSIPRSLMLLAIGVMGCGTSADPVNAPTGADASGADAFAADTDNPFEDAPGLDDVVNPPLDSASAETSMLMDAGMDAGPPIMQRSCPIGTERGCGVVALTGGTFAMGEIGANAATPVQSNITISPFAIDAYEVTVARFRRFWDAGRPAPTGPIMYSSGSIAWAGTVREPVRTTTLKLCNWSPTAATRESHPLACLDWWTAQAFCVWDGGRLPTAAEFEWTSRHRAAGGMTVPRTYPWGNETGSPGCDRAQWNFCKGDDTAPTRQVGSFAGTPDIFDLGGNVREWLADSYVAYTDSGCWGGAARTNPLCSLGATSLREYRGGSWCSTTIDTLKSAARYARSATSPNDFLGFRCARNR